MKKHIKIMIAVAFVCLVAVVGSIIFFKTKNNDAYITKKQWMEKLDSMEYFQSSYYVEDEGDEIATGEFIALTSMEMIGETRLNIYMRTIGKSEYDDKDTLFVDASDAFDFIKKDSLDKKISGDEIETLFSDFEIIYNEDSWVDDFVEITYSDSLIAIGDENIVSCDDSLSILKVSDVSEYKAGDVIGFTDPNTHYPTVRKIESISEDGTLAISEDVDISDVIVDATCSDIEEISLDNMLLSGYEEIPSNNATAETMSLRDGISSKGFKVHVACEDGDTTVEIEDKDSGKTYKSPVMSSQNDDSDYDVTIDVSGMYTKACWEYKWKEGFTYAEVNLIDTVSVSSQIGSVDIVDKKIKIFDSAIPIADGVLWVEFEFYIVFDAEGNVSLEMTVPMNVQGVWSKDGGLKTTKQASGEAIADLTGDINGNIMLRSEAVLSLFYLIDLIDAEVDVGANVKAEETIRSTGMICADVSIYCPIVKVSVCGDQNEKKKTYRSLIGTIMDNSISYDIIDEDNAPQYRMFHYELINGVGKEVDECTYGKDEEQAISEVQETTEKNTEKNAESQNIDVSVLYGLPQQVELAAKQYDINVENVDDGTGDTIELRTAELDIVDTGNGYRMNIATVKYYLGVSTVEFNTFIEKAIQDNGNSRTDMNGDKVIIYDIVGEYAVLTCAGEKFTLSYCEDGGGMSRLYHCEFIGEDGETYTMIINMGLVPDSFTDMMYYPICKDSQQVYREVTYEDDFYIDIPYDMANGTDIADCANNSGHDYSNSKPGAGQYYIQFSSDGQIVKLQGLWTDAY